ncbi:ferrous iron transport protein B [Desulfocicer vacuolatum DSM 3385]|uniref:Ferrous iron transport protein B n=1 Tax=Desulfocicer vacuolatum DSM 3385 TaxID=1121400 RepID=A0A1W2EF04_9BACT|nr:ferrous iron transport protein B [Desulfocicer vacuolatum]SMD08309.1 ferrous iron transport protein B [Desulfocicer vacuolatum DSM 3385]
MAQHITAALAGNPNCGKTTMFNALTGARQHVGNYPGVTVEKRSGTVKSGEVLMDVVDLPGTYSLTAYSPEELVARDFIVDERPQVVINILDATSLERNLYLSIQFMELGAPMVLALNMMDAVKKQGKTIDVDMLSTLLGLPVVETVARTGAGKHELIQQTIAFIREKEDPWKPLHISYGSLLDPVLREMEEIIAKNNFLTHRFPARWIGLKYLEEDEQIIAMGETFLESCHHRLLKLAEKTRTRCLKNMDMAPDAIIADYRYGHIAAMMKQGVVKRDTTGDRINLSDNIDRVLTSRFLGPIIMLATLYGIFQITFPIGEIPMGWVEAFFEWLAMVAVAVIPAGFLQSLVVDGIIGGVGGVMGFVPLIMVMFMAITILEDVGYMARMAYMMDRVFRIFGLHGASLMPFIISGGIPGGCAVPGVMAARTLRSPKEKLATILTAPFMNCGAKVPVFLLLSAAFFPHNAAGVMFGMTLVSWAVALVVAKLLRSTVIRGEATPFVMELPPYRMPTLRGVLIHTWERAWQYMKKAGTVILGISILIWASMTFPGVPHDLSSQFQARQKAVEAEMIASPSQKQQLQQALVDIENMENQAALRYSFAGRVGSFFEPVTRLAGFDWRTNIALLGGFAAKEVIVSSLGTVYSLGAVDADDSASLGKRLLGDPMWSPVGALALMVFVLLYAPCFVTVAVISKETSWRWAAFSVMFNTALAFCLAVGVYQVGNAVF